MKLHLLIYRILNSWSNDKRARAAAHCRGVEPVGVCAALPGIGRAVLGVWYVPRIAIPTPAGAVLGPHVLRWYSCWTPLLSKSELALNLAGLFIDQIGHSRLTDMAR